MARCKVNSERVCVGEALPEKIDCQTWDEERRLHYDLAEAVANGCRPDPDHTRPVTEIECPKCRIGRMIDQRHRNGTIARTKIQIVCSHCRYSGYRLE